MDPKTVTDALNGVARGDEKALHLLLPVVYREMKRLAAGFLKAERPGHTLQPTALAHEAYLRLVGRDRIQWQNRAHFLGVAARAMREILVDHARRRRAQKRGGGQQPVTLVDDALLVVDRGRPIEFDDLDRALNDLARLSERQSHVVELRYFGGLSIEETAEVLSVSPATVKREWATARAWLYRELSGSGPTKL